MSQPHLLHLQIYYEDTDHSGVVYHANYLKFFERAREHLLGVEHLVSLYQEDGIGFVVYKAELTYKKGAQFGDHITIQTTLTPESDYRLIFHQNALLQMDQSLLVQGRIELVCVDEQKKLVRLPAIVVQKLQEGNYL